MVTRAALAASLGSYVPPRGAKIGLLGGSFNPAHEGHRHISLEALKRLDLDEVWWLVSPQNPLKSSDDMGALADRVASARTVAAHPRIRVTALEALYGVQYTADTVSVLTRQLPGVRFVWLMGADNLRQIASWQDWPQIFHTLVIAVFDRPSYSLPAVSSIAAYRFARQRLREEQARKLATLDPPAWVYIHSRLVTKSATEIRTRQRQDAASGSGQAAPLDTSQDVR